MGEYKLKIKIGDHEFEAEGPADIVQEQFAAFRDLVGTAKSEGRQDSKADTAGAGGTTPPSNGALPLEKIMTAEGRIVSLTVRAASVADAAMLLLLGQRHFRANDAVTGSEILDGLQQSGQPVNRIDQTMNKLADDGSVIAIGMNRAKRYRLSNAGVTKAQELSRNLIATVP